MVLNLDWLFQVVVPVISQHGENPSAKKRPLKEKIESVSLISLRTDQERNPAKSIKHHKAIKVWGRSDLYLPAEIARCHEIRAHTTDLEFLMAH